jgi:stress response protein YsnF
MAHNQNSLKYYKIKILKQAYGDKALSGTQVFEWYAILRDRCENLEDERSVRPTAVRTPDTIETVRELISTNRRMTLRMMEEELKISRDTIRTILMEDLA